MKLIDIELKNFMSYTNEKINIENLGSVFIYGENGAGKSTIGFAICYALFGKTPITSGVQQAKNLVRYCSDPKDSYCSLTFSEKNEIYRIVRGPSKAELDHYDDLLLKWNRLSEGRTADEMIATIVGWDWEVFETMIIFGRDTIKFAEESDSVQKKILENILGTHKLGKCLDITRKLIKNQQETIDLFKRDLSVLTGKSQGLECRLSGPTTESTRNPSDIEVDIDNIKNEIALLQEEASLFKSDISELENIKSEISNLESLRRLLNNEINAYENRIYNNNKQLSKLNSDITNIKENKICTLCSTPIQDNTIDSISKRTQEESERLNNDNSRLQNKITVNKATLVETTESLEKRNKKLNEKISVENKVRNITLHQVPIKKQELKTKEIELENAKLHLAKQEEVRKIKEEICKIKKDMEFVKSEIEEAGDQVKDLQFWEEAFSTSGIRSLLLDEIRPYLIERANKYASLLFEGGTTIDINTVTWTKDGEPRDKFSVEASVLGGSPIYSTCSAGQKQKINLCIALALRDLALTRSNLSINIMIFDEVFESVDEAGVDRITDLIKAEADRFGTCFVISHMEHMRDKFDNKWFISLNNGASEIRRI